MWQRKSNIQWKRKYNKPKNTNRNNQSSFNHNDPKWKPKKDLQSKRVQQFVDFFKSPSYTKQEMQNAPTMIEELLSQNVLNEQKIDEFHNFSPLSHCIFNIVKTYKFAKDVLYQTFLLNQWILIIKILSKYNADFFQCIHCKSNVSIYDQYNQCEQRGERNNNSMYKRNNHNQWRTQYKLHNTPFKQLFIFFREDLNESQLQHNKMRLKKGKFWWTDINIQQRIDNVHECLYSLLGFILKTNDIILPIARLQFGKVHLGLTPGYCEYEWKVHLFHVCLPVFPSYKILYNLLSIHGVIPYTFIHQQSYVYHQLSHDILMSKYLQKYDHNVNGVKDDVPKNWMVALLYTFQQVFAGKIAKAIGDDINKDIISIILEFIYDDQYEGYFGGAEFLSNYENIQNAVLLMKKYNVHTVDGDNKDNNNYRTVSDKKYVPFKHRTTTPVIESWLNAFENPLFRHTFCKLGILNEDAMDEKRRDSIAVINKEIKYYVNVEEERYKFECLMELLMSSNKCKWIIICEHNETAEQLEHDLAQHENEEIGRYVTMDHFSGWMMKNITIPNRRGLIGTYSEHKTQWKNEGNCALILYDFPLNIDELISQISGYEFVICLTTSSETKNQCVQFKDKYGIRMLALPENYAHLIEQKYRID